MLVVTEYLSSTSRQDPTKPEEILFDRLSLSRHIRLALLAMALSTPRLSSAYSLIIWRDLLEHVNHQARVLA